MSWAKHGRKYLQHAKQIACNASAAISQKLRQFFAAQNLLQQSTFHAADWAQFELYITNYLCMNQMVLYMDIWGVKDHECQSEIRKLISTAGD